MVNSEKKWYVSLGDGTFVEMDESPYVFLATKDQIKDIDVHGGNAPIDCGDDGAHERVDNKPVFESHIHIRDLVLFSHWDDHTPVTERTTPDRINS